MVVEGDTIVVITPIQLAVANGIIQERNGLLGEVSELERLVGVQDSIISISSEQRKAYRALIERDDMIIQNLNEALKIEKKRKIGGVLKSGCLGLVVGTIVGILLK